MKLTVALCGLLTTSAINDHVQNIATQRSLQRLSPNDVVKNIMEQMTVEEKARQLSINDGNAFMTNGELDLEKTTQLMMDRGIGKVDTMGRNVDPVIVNAIQEGEGKEGLEATRRGAKRVVLGGFVWLMLFILH